MFSLRRRNDPPPPPENNPNKKSIKDFVYDEEIPIDNPEDIPSPDSSPRLDATLTGRNYDIEESDSDEPELQFGSSDTEKIPPEPKSKPGPSIEKKSAAEGRPKSGRPKTIMTTSSESESDSDDGLMVVEGARGPIPGEYNPEQYINLQVSEEIRELFQYITKYTPQHLNLDYKFKPFIPDYIPAVGDIDAFLKVVPPERTLSGEVADFKDLGLAVLDEPAANQSDSALLHLQLRAVSVTTSKDSDNMIIKKIENIEKNSKTIDKWIKDVSDLHRSKPPPMVRYSNPMPDLDMLMQEWPPAIEDLLRKNGFPSSKLQCSLKEYVEIICSVFDIPIYQRQIESLHMLFCLFLAIKNSHAYNNSGIADVAVVEQTSSENVTTTDQLILE